MVTFSTEPILTLPPSYGYVLIVLFFTVVVCVPQCRLFSAKATRTS